MKRDDPEPSHRYGNITTEDIIRDFSLLKKIQSSFKKEEKKDLVNFESLFDIAKISQPDKQGLNLVPPEVLYKTHLFEKQQKVYQHYSQQLIRCVNDQQIVKDLVNPNSYTKLKNSGLQTIHVGIILLGIYGLHRRHYGSKILMCLVDTRTTDLCKGIIAQAEIDLDSNQEFVYIIPERLSLTIKDFADYLKIIIKTKGYEDWISGEANLSIITAVTARLSNYIQTTFRLKESKQIATFLSSKGIQAIEGHYYDPKDLNGEMWKITIPEIVKPKQIPQTALNWQDNRHSLSIKFSDYKSVQHDESSEEEEDEINLKRSISNRQFNTLFVLTDDEYDTSKPRNDFWFDDSDCDNEEYSLPPVFDLTPPETPERIELNLLEVTGEEYDLPYPREFLFSGEVWDATMVPTNSASTSAPILPPATGPADNFKRTTAQILEDVLRTPKMEKIEVPSPLQPAKTTTGSILVFPSRIQQREEIMRIWESDTINFINGKDFDTPISKILFIENLMGENEKLTFQAWRAAYPEKLQRLINGAGNTQNITSQIRQIFLGYDEYRGNTEMQNTALLELEQLSIKSMSDFEQYAANFEKLAAKTGQIYLSTDLNDKFFRKLPSPWNEVLQKMWNEAYPQNQLGIGPRKTFALKVLMQACRQNELNRQAKDFQFCRKLHSGATNEKRLKIRRSTNYRGIPRRNHVKKVRISKPGTTKCKCWTCGEVGHYASQCKSNTVNRGRLHIHQQIELPPDWDIVSVEEDEPYDSDICSYSEDESDQQQRLNFLVSEDFDTTGTLFMINCYIQRETRTEEQKHCSHSGNYQDWNFYSNSGEQKCYGCLMFPTVSCTCKTCKVIMCQYDWEYIYKMKFPSQTISVQNRTTAQPYNYKSLIIEQAERIIKLEKENSKIDDLTQRLSFLEKEIQQIKPLQEKILEQELIISKLELQVHDLEKTNQQLNETNQILMQQNQELVTENQFLKKQNQELQQALLHQSAYESVVDDEKSKTEIMNEFFILTDDNSQITEEDENLPPVNIEEST